MEGGALWTGDDEFTLDGVAYRSMSGRSAPDQMVLLKTREMVEGYEALIETLKPRRILELGIYSGGSTALLAQLAQPEKLVALDIIDRCSALEQFIDAHGLRGALSTYYGVDQADVERLDEIVEREFCGQALDLIIDDASHLMPGTRTSFNRLFPRLRPGGVYLIEDWSWPHHRMVHPDPSYHGVQPLSAFICELVLASACRPRVIAEVSVHHDWAIVRRGPADLNPGRFDIGANFDPIGRDMVERLDESRSLSPDMGADVLRIRH